MRERRERLFYLPSKEESPSREAITIRAHPGTVELFVKILGLPKETTLRVCSWRPERRAYGFIFAHPSFDVVPEGGLIPEITPSLGV